MDDFLVHDTNQFTLFKKIEFNKNRYFFVHSGDQQTNNFIRGRKCKTCETLCHTHGFQWAIFKLLETEHFAIFLKKKVLSIKSSMLKFLTIF